MRRPHLLGILAICSYFLMGSYSFASTIDFQSVGSDSCFFLLGSSVDIDGYRLSDSIPGSSLFTCNGSTDPRPFGTNGTRALLTRNVEITSIDGALFSLHRFEVGEVQGLSIGESTRVEITGTKADGSTVSTIFNFDGLIDGTGINDFQIVNLGSGFSDLISARIVGQGDPTGGENFFIDNINITAVPLPPALYLFGSGLLGLIGIARKKTS